MLEPNPAVRFDYPAGVAERYDPAVVDIGRIFTVMLFDPDNLGLVTHPDFLEITGGQVTLRGLEELQMYRRRFGHPILYSVSMIAVPPSLRAEIPDGSGRRFTLDHLFELRFGILPEDVPPGGPKLPPGTPPVTTVVRMREPYDIRRVGPNDRPVPGTDPNQLWVFGRTYQPIGETGPLADPHGQLPFVIRQLEHFARTGRTMIEDGLIRPLAHVYNDMFPGLV